MKTKNLKILQWNINGFYRKLDELKLLISEHFPEIICLQETNFNTLKTGILKNYKEFSFNRTNCLRASGGVAIYVKSDYPSKPINITTHLEVVAASVKLNDIELNICNIYLPNQHNFNKNDIENILHQIPKPFIITGDFNSHSIEWGSKKTDNRGKEIEKVLENDHLILLNNLEPTRINPVNGELSFIDLSFANASLAQRTEWNVLSNLTSSDHFPILIQIIPRHNDTTHVAERWNLKNPDWPLFTEFLELEISKIKNPETLSIRQLTETLTNHILNTGNLTIGKTKTKDQKPKVPWWNQNIKDALKAKKGALIKFKKTNNPDDLIILKQLRAKSKYLIKKSKKISWEKFTSSINDKVDNQLIWNKIKSLKGLSRNNKIHLVDKNTNKLMSNFEVISNKFGEYFYNNSSDSNFDREFIPFKQHSEKLKIVNTVIENQNDQILLNHPITSNEIFYFLKKCKSTSPGPDQIPYVFIRNFGSKTFEILTTLYNKILVEGTWPTTWKSGIVIPIPKPGKDKFHTEGYRPITLLNTMCKLLEKILNHRLNWLLEKNSFFSPHQNGFRKNRCTIDNLTEIKEEITQTLNKKQIMGIINLDITKAYDSTWRHNILVILNKIIGKGNFLNLITNFLENRTFRVRANNFLSNMFIQENGVPQGSALSVSLFLVAINDITENCLHPVKFNLYADDFNFWCRSKSKNTTQSLLQSAATKLENWAKKTGFQFSPQKSSCTIFTKKRNVDALKITIDRTEVAYRNSTKMLGVIFDRRLSWSPYIKQLKTSTCNSVKILKILSHTTWGGETNTLIKIHKTLIQSKLNYGSLLYRTASKSLLNWLDTVNNCGLRLALGAFRSSPVLSIYNLAGEITPEIKRLESYLIYAARSAKLNNTFHEKNNPRFLEEMRNCNLDISQIIIKEKNVQPPWANAYAINTELSCLPKLQTSPYTYKNFFKSIIDNHKDFQEVYTDGSKTNEGVGFSIIFPNKKILHKLPNICSIFTAEMMAILTATEVIIQEAHSKFIILSDSLSSIKSLQNQFNPCDIASKIQNNLSKASFLGKEIIIMWIPGHSGISGNEIADEHASIAINNNETLLKNQMTYADAKKSINEYTKNKWQKLWNSQNTKLNEIKRDIYQWTNPKLTRKEETVLNRLRIGHTRITHGFLMAREDAPICQTCGTALTVKHIIADCLMYEQERVDHRISYHLDTALGPNQEKTIDLINFIKQTKLFNII